MSDLRLPDPIAETLVTSADYASDKLYDAYRWMRANNPLGVAEVEGFSPFWVVTKHADILEISRNNARFPGSVRELAPEADPRSRTYNVRVSLSEATPEGLSARCTVAFFNLDRPGPPGAAGTSPATGPSAAAMPVAQAR